MFCSECGTEINNNSKFCYKCGHKINREGSAALKGINAMICERCGSNELIRQGSIYVCRICNTKYNVGATDAENIEKWRKIARDCYDGFKDIGKAKLYFDKIYESDPDDIEARFFSFHCGRLMIDFDSVRSDEKIDDIKYTMSREFNSCFERAMKTMEPGQVADFLFAVILGIEEFISLLQDSLGDERKNKKNSFEHEFEFDFMVARQVLFFSHAVRVMQVDFVNETIELYEELVKETSWPDGKREVILNEILYRFKVLYEVYNMLNLNVINSEELRIKECLGYMDVCKIPKFMEYMRSEDRENFEKAIKIREEWKRKGLCQHCGGKITLIKKKCSECGWPKDY